MVIPGENKRRIGKILTALVKKSILLIRETCAKHTLLPTQTPVIKHFSLSSPFPSPGRVHQSGEGPFYAKAQP
jgi:hypothetical protein